MRYQQPSPLFAALLLDAHGARYRPRYVNQNYTLLHAGADRLGDTPAMAQQHGTHP